MAVWWRKLLVYLVHAVFLVLLLLLFVWISRTWWALLLLPVHLVAYLFATAMVDVAGLPPRAADKEDARPAPPFRRGTRPLAVLRKAQGEELRDADTGDAVQIELLPPITPDEPVPEEIRELLAVTRRISIGSHEITLDPLAAEAEDFIPCGVEVGHDGAGNFWIVDVDPETRVWGPVYFVSHDPPTIAYGFSSVAEYIHNVFNLYRRGVKRERVSEIELLPSTRKELPTVAAARRDADEVLARALDGAYDDGLVADMRDPKRLHAWDWDAFGAETVVRRPTPEPIWILERP